MAADRLWADEKDVARENIGSLSVEDLNASRLSDDDIFGATWEMELTSGGYAIGSVLRSPGFSRGHVNAIDDLLLSSFGDHFSHSPASWIVQSASLRNDLRGLLADLMQRKDMQGLESASAWIRNAPRPELHNYAQSTLLHLRSVATETLSHLLQKENDRGFSANVLELLSRSVFDLEDDFGRNFAATSDGIEVKWILASHPDTPASVLAKFAPTDLQWLSVLTHPNTSQPVLTSVILSALDSQFQGAMDGGNISAALSHACWTTDNLRQLYKGTPPYLRSTLMRHLLEHPTCPVDYLERHYSRLSAPSLIRLASLSDNLNILEELSLHPDRDVREATKLNPVTPEHAKVAAALANLSR